MHYQGILISAATFLLIGSFHVVVIGASIILERASGRSLPW